MPWILATVALGAVLGAEKLGDFFNAKSGIVQVPVTSLPGAAKPAPAAAVSLGAAALTAAAVAWYVTRRKK